MQRADRDVVAAVSDVRVSDGGEDYRFSGRVGPGGAHPGAARDVDAALAPRDAGEGELGARRRGRRQSRAHESHHLDVDLLGHAVEAIDHGLGAAGEPLEPDDAWVAVRPVGPGGALLADATLG